MGLQIKKSLGESPGEWYIPAFRGNRLSADPIEVEILPLTGAQNQARKERDFRGMKAGEVIRASTAHRNAVIAERVKAVMGVADESGALVSDGKSLVKAIAEAVDAGLDDLLDEIYGAIVDRSKLDEGRRPS